MVINYEVCLQIALSYSNNKFIDNKVTIRWMKWNVSYLGASACISHINSIYLLNCNNKNNFTLYNIVVWISKTDAFNNKSITVLYMCVCSHIKVDCYCEKFFCAILFRKFMNTVQLHLIMWVGTYLCRLHIGLQKGL